jgi:hypothetical protein
VADLFQGSALPATVTTTEDQQTAPEFYTNYLQDIANLGQGAIQQGGVAGMSPLQMQALNMAPTASMAGMGTMGQGAQLAGAAGTTATPDIMQSYMNPYTSNVVDEMARLQGRSIKESVLPALQGAAGAMGQFGSQRQYQATGQTLRDMQANLLGQQYGALNTGYQNAATTAQADLQRQLQSGQALGQIGTQQQTGATTGMKTMFDLGSKEQALGQSMLDRPMLDAQAYSKLMQGYQIPTGAVKQVTGSTGYANSPLSQITGLLAALGSGVTGKDGGGIHMAEGGLPSAPSMPQGAQYHDEQGNFYDANGYLLG